MRQLYVRMLGEFSLRSEYNHISERNDRSKKVWLLLGYLLTHRGQIIPRRTLMELLWGEDSAGGNPESSLKAVMYRLRTLLNQLWPSAGHELILYKKDGYTWNDEIETVIDMESFEMLCKRPPESEEERINELLEAQNLYKGDFLDSFSSEPWVTSLSVYFHNMYIQAVLELIQLLEDRERHAEIMTVCKSALLVESYHEPLHFHLMRALIAMGDYKATTEVYEKLTQQMFEEFGQRPSEESMELYRTALQTMKNERLSMNEVLDYLDEPMPEGALECDYDYFKVISRAEARTVRRTGIQAHIALLSVSGFADKELSKKSMEIAMDHLGEKIRKALRQSDAYSRCSIAQYALMLPQTSYANGCAVCDRIVSSYMKKYPSSPIVIRYTVEALVNGSAGRQEHLN